MVSLARIAGADELASCAEDLQEFCEVFTAGELADEIARLGRLHSRLVSDLRALNPEQRLSGSPAS
jgi:hypothetical protein